MKERIVFMIGIIILLLLFIIRDGCNTPYPEVDIPDSFIIIDTNSG